MNQHNMDQEVPPGSPKKGVMRWLWDITIVLLAVWAVNAWYTRDMLATNQTIRSFNVVSLSGAVTEVKADPERPTLMYFFAPWCSVCRASIGNLDDLDPDKVQLYVIALDYKSQNEVEQFVSDVGLESPVYLGTNEIRDGFAVKAYPSYYVLDESFSITSRTVGYSTSLGMWLRTL